jgi:hypothetical protein
MKMERIRNKNNGFNQNASDTLLAEKANFNWDLL